MATTVATTNASTKWWAIGILTTALVATVSYAIYFDYKRRSDPIYRQKWLKKQRQLRATVKAQEENKEKVEEPNKQESGESTESQRDETLLDLPLRAVLEMNEGQRTQLLQVLITRGEMLAAQGPAHYEMAARFFAKATNMLPNPLHFLEVLKQSLPPVVVQRLVILLQQQGAKQLEEFIDEITPKNALISCELVQPTAWEKGPEKMQLRLVASRDIAAGEVVFTETPFVSVGRVDASLCAHCQKSTDQTFCSDICESSYKALFDRLFPSKESEGPLSRLCKEKLLIMPLLVARFMARVNEEPQKSAQAFIHLETMRFHREATALTSTVEEAQAVESILKGRLRADMDSLLEAQGYAALKCLLMGNTLAIRQEGGSLSIPDDANYVRVPFSKKEIVGYGIYRMAGYLPHSCDPLLKVTFSQNNHIASFISRRAISRGEALTMAYMDPSGSSHGQRKTMLRDGFALDCQCDSCEAELPGQSVL